MKIMFGQHWLESCHNGIRWTLDRERAMEYSQAMAENLLTKHQYGWRIVD